MQCCADVDLYTQYSLAVSNTNAHRSHQCKNISQLIILNYYFFSFFKQLSTSMVELSDYTRFSTTIKGTVGKTSYLLKAAVIILKVRVAFPHLLGSYAYMCWRLCWKAKVDSSNQLGKRGHWTGICQEQSPIEMVSYRGRRSQSDS